MELPARTHGMFRGAHSDALETSASRNNLCLQCEHSSIVVSLTECSDTRADRPMVICTQITTHCGTEYITDNGGSQYRPFSYMERWYTREAARLVAESVYKRSVVELQGVKNGDSAVSRGANMHTRQAPEYAARTSLEPWQVPTLYGRLSNVGKRT